MQRRTFLMGLGAFTGAAIAVPKRTIFDMGRALVASQPGPVTYLTAENLRDLKRSLETPMWPDGQDALAYLRRFDDHYSCEMVASEMLARLDVSQITAVRVSRAFDAPQAEVRISMDPDHAHTDAEMVAKILDRAGLRVGRLVQPDAKWAPLVWVNDVRVPADRLRLAAA